MEPNNKVTPLLILVLIIFAFATGSLWTKVRTMEKTTKEGAKIAQASPTASAKQPEQLVVLGEQDQAEILKESLRVKGDKDAKVTIVEFSEFQCPYCKKYVDEAYASIMKDYGDKVRYVFRDYPLPFHSHAQEAAEASRCAGDQGKFWEYHDKLFANQTTWSALEKATDSFVTYASELSLDQAKFSTCLSSGQFTQEVKNDFALGQKVGVSGTPSFFVNGQKLVGAQPYEAFKALIEEELK